MIVPALLTDKKDKLSRMVEVCAGFTDFVQIDIMDGNFVPSESLGIKDLVDLSIPLRSEAHLMVVEPLAWLDIFRQLASEKIIYHFEISVDHSKVISEIKQKGFKVGLAINPETSLADFNYLVPKLDSVLFMSVNPGFYGAKFIPEVLAKIKKFKAAYPNIVVGIDGGIKLDNAKMVKSTGVDYICVGSAILKSEDPAKAYQDILDITNE